MDRIATQCWPRCLTTRRHHLGAELRNAERAGPLTRPSQRDAENSRSGRRRCTRPWRRGTTSGRIGPPEVVPLFFTARRGEECPQVLCSFLRPSALRAKRACAFCVPAVGVATDAWPERDTPRSAKPSGACQQRVVRELSARSSSRSQRPVPSGPGRRRTRPYRLRRGT